jgi:hypothetical protein
MQLEELLIRHQDEIVDSWFDSVINTYAPDTARFFKAQKDPFSNPVGSIAQRALKKLFEILLVEPFDHKSALDHLDPLIRVRAVQDFTPSLATGFVTALKGIVRATLKKKLDDRRLLDDLVGFEARVDGLQLLAFDVYMACREKIYDLKANTEKSKIYKAFSRAGLVEELPDNGPARDPLKQP